MSLIYFLTKDNKIIDNYTVAAAAKIVHNRNISGADWNEIRQYTEYCRGIKKEIIPNLSDFLKRGQKEQAYRYYRDHHPELSLKECVAYVNIVAEAIKKEKN